MKKMNAKGFTLIELLAVITIMGILMIVAIPAVTRTIENSRKDTFVNTVQNYVNGAKTMWASDNLNCGTSPNDFVSSAVASGLYYIEVNSTSDTVPQLLESGGKSPWGSRNMAGYILVHVRDVTNNGVTTRKTDFYPVMVDGIHGINLQTDGTKLAITGDPKLVISEGLKRGNLIMSGLGYDKLTNSATLSNSSTIHLPGDLNNDGDTTDTNEFAAIKCVEV